MAVAHYIRIVDYVYVCLLYTSKAFDDPMLDSLITVASTQNYSVLSAMDRMDTVSYTHLSPTDVTDI